MIASVMSQLLGLYYITLTDAVRKCGNDSIPYSGAPVFDLELNT